jgi:hypothetical protein
MIIFHQRLTAWAADAARPFAEAVTDCEVDSIRLSDRRNRSRWLDIVINQWMERLKVAEPGRQPAHREGRPDADHSLTLSTHIVPFTILCEPHHRARSESVANAARTFEINPERPLAKLSVYDRFAPVFAIGALLRASQKQMFARRTTIRKPR